MPVLPSLARIYEDARAAGTASQFTARDLRRLLESAGWSCSDEDWKEGGLRDEAKDAWAKLMDNDGEGDASSPPPAKKPKTSTAGEDGNETQEKKGAKKKTEARSKYDKAADRNFQTFAAAMVDEVVEGLAGGAAAVAAALGPGGLNDSSNDEEEDEDYAGSSSGSSPASPPKKRKKASTTASDSHSSDDGDDSESVASSSAPKKSKARPSTNGKGKGKAAPAKKGGRKGKAPAGGFKSAELIADSDDSSNELPPSKAVPDASDDEDGSSKKKGKKRASSVGSGASKGKGKADKPKKERKPAAPKPGDAEKGTEEEEERIKKLKALLTAASGPRAFSASTGAERTLTASRRIEILENHLAKLGLPVKNGKLPTMSKAKEIGEQRQLDKEMAELGGNPLHAGLRDGKQINADSDDDTASGPSKKKLASGSASKKNVVAERKKFAAFLGDQSSDSD